MQFFKKTLLRLPAPLIAGTLWFISSQTTLPQPPGSILGWDKLHHFMAYGVLGFCIGLWITQAFWKRRPALAVLLTTMTGSLYGAIDEIRQYFVPGRYCDIWDWVANTLGALTGALFMMFIMMYKQHKQKELENIL